MRVATILRVVNHGPLVQLLLGDGACPAGEARLVLEALAALFPTGSPVGQRVGYEVTLCGGLAALQDADTVLDEEGGGGAQAGQQRPG
jgi:hypothetical protein